MSTRLLSFLMSTVLGSALALSGGACTGILGVVDGGGGRDRDSGAGDEGGGDQPPGPDAATADTPVGSDLGPPDLASTPDGPGPSDGGLPDFPVPADAGPSSTRLQPRLAGTTDSPLGFHEYLPPGYGEGPPRPLLVFLHGVGENGNGSADELPIVLRNGLAALIDRDQWPADRPFVVLSPQHPGEGCPGADEVRDFIAFALATYELDPRRIYLTGLSCGAIGAWTYLGQNLGTQITAMVAIAGDGRGAWNQAGCRLGEVPLWAFHGDDDDTVAPAGSIEPLTDLEACPSPPRQEVRLTVYPGVGHDSWTRTYDGSAGHDIYSWLLGFARPAVP